MVECDASGFRQDELSPGALEQTVAQSVLQLADLSGQRGLGEVQPLRRAGEIALSRDRAKILEMVIVQLDHNPIKSNVMIYTMYFI